MHEPRNRDRRKDAHKFIPYPLLFRFVVGPKGVLNGTLAGADANADQIVEITIRQTFDIQIDGGAVESLVWEVDGVDFVLADGKRPQRMMKFLLLASRCP